MIKERYFGLSNPEGNHGEDVKELYYYLDSTPTHSYMKMLYKYPQAEFPYQWLLAENKKRTRNEPEFELIDTGIFDEDKYFDVFVEYAKKGPENILIKITVHNRGNDIARLDVLPAVWFRNTWLEGGHIKKPEIVKGENGALEITHKDIGFWKLHYEENPEILFCDNETNTKRLYNYDDDKPFYKDGINDYIIYNAPTINPGETGTKATLKYDLTIEPQQSTTLRLLLSKGSASFTDFDNVFATRKKEADSFYSSVLHTDGNGEVEVIQRQAFAGLLWNKQFYHFDASRWIQGDPGFLPLSQERASGKNGAWKHVSCKDIISVPDKWEFPWFALWDSAFHCLPLALVDIDFAKKQLLLFTNTRYMHPNGQMPAYEWDFSDSNPPLHAVAAWIVYSIEKDNNKGRGDIKFLEKIFHKLMLNFAWWVNRKDANGSNIFEGGFLGLDNISVFDRNMQLPGGYRLEQADATSWMAMYALNLSRIAAELHNYNDVYDGIAEKFFEHFLSIAGTVAGMNLWDGEDGFYYDRLRFPNGEAYFLKVRSIIGFIPLFAVEIVEKNDIKNKAAFYERMEWYHEHRPDLSILVSRWDKENTEGKYLFGLLDEERLKIILQKMLDENEFLSAYGIRSLSRYHKEHPFSFNANGNDLTIQYVPGDSDSDVYGGNSNWRGPIWIPINFLIIESLRRYHAYYGNDFTIECPTGSGNLLNLNEIADELAKRLSYIFLKDENGYMAGKGTEQKFQADPLFKDYHLFHEYFDGDTGKGLGASHQTGWTSLIIRYLFMNKSDWSFMADAGVLKK